MRLPKAGIIAIAAMAICVLVLSGCQSTSKVSVKPPSKTQPSAIAAEKPTPEAAAVKSVPLALKFVSGDTTKYKVIMEGKKRVEWEGAVPNKAAFQNALNTSTIEMTFTQKIQSVKSDGNAVAAITIDGLKYKAVLKESTVIDFDSSRTEDANAPMAKLIGKSYTIELTPSGQVGQIVDVNSAMAAVRGDSAAQRAAMRLLESEVIKDRHSALSLPTGDNARISTGQNWKNTRTFAFGIMGPVSYERVYTLEKVEKEGNHDIALVRMKAVPTAESVEEVRKEQMTSRIAKAFDNNGQYDGELKFDLSSGKVEKLTEEFKMEWLAARPSSEVNAPQAEPASLKIGAERFYSIEEIK